MRESLYRRLGGQEGIAALVDEAVDRHAVNPLLAPLLRARDLPEVKRLGTRWLCARIGAPPAGTSACLPEARLAAELGEAQFRSALRDIVAALDGQGVAPPDVAEVVDLLLAIRAKGPGPHRPACAAAAPPPPSGHPLHWQAP